MGFVHICIHGRRNVFFTLTCHDRGSQHIVCHREQAFHHIGACRSDHHHICLFCNGHMFYLELKIPVKSIYQTFVSCKRFKCNGIDKIRGILSLIHEPAHEASLTRWQDKRSYMLQYFLLHPEVLFFPLTFRFPPFNGLNRPKLFYLSIYFTNPFF